MKLLKSVAAIRKYFYFQSGMRLLLCVVAIMAVQAYAAFSYGAYFIGPMTFCVVSLWMIFLTWFIWLRDDFLPIKPTALTSALLLAGLWLWAGLSFFWSISSDLTWVEFNRSGGYLAAFLLGIIASHSKSARTLAAWLFLLIASAAAVYGLCVKILPQIVDNVDNLARIGVPIGYINGMGLLVALAVPLSLYYSASKDIGVIFRLPALLANPLLLVCLFFTLSRGAFVALIVGLVAYFALVPLRLRSFFLLLITALPAFLIAWWSSGQDALMLNRVDLGARMEAAGPLRLYLLTALILLAAIFLTALLIGRYIHVPKKVTKTAGALVLFAVLAALTTGSVLFISSKPSFGEWANQAHRNFTKPPNIGTGVHTGSSRLLEIRSSGRWQLWQEAQANWQENASMGSGAQSFPLTHLMQRQYDFFVKQPHGLAFRLLTELGVAGFALGAAFICFTLFLGMLGWARIPDRAERGLMGTLISVILIYLVHTSFDWDWNIFALTMPYMFFSGITVGWFGELRALSGGCRRRWRLFCNSRPGHPAQD